VLKCLSGKTRKPINIVILQASATQSGRMHRRLKCDVIFARTLSVVLEFDDMGIKVAQAKIEGTSCKVILQRPITQSKIIILKT
jgi:hypothetical protein